MNARTNVCTRSLEPVDREKCIAGWLDAHTRTMEGSLCWGCPVGVAQRYLFAHGRPMSERAAETATKRAMHTVNRQRRAADEAKRAQYSMADELEWFRSSTEPRSPAELSERFGVPYWRATWVIRCLVNAAAIVRVAPGRYEAAA